METMLASVQQHPSTPPGNAIRLAAEAYAQWECVEADVCASNAPAGSPQDLATAQAAEQRLNDLCAQLRQIPTYVRQCP